MCVCHLGQILYRPEDIKKVIAQNGPKAKMVYRCVCGCSVALVWKKHPVIVLFLLFACLLCIAAGL